MICLTPFPRYVERKSPRIDQQTCRKIGEREETLLFEYQLPNLPGISDAICNATEMDAYRACLEKNANSICRGRVESLDQARCFRHVAVLIYRNTGIGGYAKDLAEGSMAPFTDCRNGYCKFSGGGSRYTCTRISSDSIKECDGDNCADVSCPIRRCRVICGAKSVGAVPCGFVMARRIRDGRAKGLRPLRLRFRRARGRWDLLCLFPVRRSADRSGNPIVAEQGPDCYAINYAALHAWIEMAHRPLIEIDDAARR